MDEIYYNRASSSNNFVKPATVLVSNPYGKWELAYDYPADMIYSWLSTNTNIDSIKKYVVADSSDSHYYKKFESREPYQEENDELEMSFDDLFE